MQTEPIAKKGKETDQSSERDDPARCHYPPVFEGVLINLQHVLCPTGHQLWVTLLSWIVAATVQKVKVSEQRVQKPRECVW